MVYHLARSDDHAVALCPPEFWREGDVVVPRAEVERPEGRHFNCVECHKVLTGGHPHSRPGSERR